MMNTKVILLINNDTVNLTLMIWLTPFVTGVSHHFTYMGFTAFRSER